MPGGRGGAASVRWFREVFGFAEENYSNTKKRFACLDGVLQLFPSTEARWYVGPFEVLSVEDLRARLIELPLAPEVDGLRFENIVGNTHDMHLDPANADAVFQVSSQFNCLEMASPEVCPQHGITNYAKLATQGAACALSCPAATVHRNYKVPVAASTKGQGDGIQIDCLEKVGEFVENHKELYWEMKNGYAMPCTCESINKLGESIKTDPDLAGAIRSRVQVGIHWDTEVLGGTHRVCQVFCSACPVAYSKSTRGLNAKAWQPLAECILDAVFEATLAAAACLALQRRARVTVYLTAVGAGSLGNRSAWVARAIDKALTDYAAAPLDVMLVHFAKIPRSALTDLEKGRHKPVLSEGGKSFEREPAKVEPPGLVRSESSLAKLVLAFAALDTNGDGVLDEEEFATVLRTLDPLFFSDAALRRMFSAADSNSDGEVHYPEFTAWLCGEDSAVASRLLATLGDSAALPDTDLSLAAK